MTERDIVLIMGLGLHGGGIGVANYFIKKGWKVLITDLKTRKELRESIEKLVKSRKVRYVLGRHRYRDFRRASLIIKNPAVRPDSPFLNYARARGIRVESDIGIFLEEVLKKSRNIIGITGTKGKSTTGSLIHRAISMMCPQSILAGNIGISVFDAIERVKEDIWMVLELSSFQLGSIREKGFSPHVAVLTNFMQDHLNYYRNMEEYFHDKEVIYKYQKPGDILVINRDTELFNMVKPSNGVRVLSFGIEPGFDGEGVYVKSDGSIDGGKDNQIKKPVNDNFSAEKNDTADVPERAGDFNFEKDKSSAGSPASKQCSHLKIKKGEVYFRGEEGDFRVLSLERIKLFGIHNIYNILAATAVCVAIGLKPDCIQRAFEDFNPLEHRLEVIHERSGFRIINDTAATTPDAAISAIRSVEKPVVLIAGGYDKGVDLEEFVRVINEEVDRLALLEGSGTGRMLEMGIEREYRLFDDFSKAIEYALKHSHGRGTVILSPGFASFGMFRNEFHRGNEFKRIVKELLSRGIV